MQEGAPKARLIVVLTLGLAAFGFAPILVRLAPGTSPFLLAAYRTLFSVLLLLPFWLWYRDRNVAERFKGNNVWWLTAGAGVALGIHFICWIASIGYTSVASASVLVTTHPIMLIVAERFLFRQKYDTPVWAGVVIALLGSIFLGWSDQVASDSFPNPVLGNSLAFLAAVIFVVYFLIGRKVRQELEWIDYIYRIYGAAAITCLIFVLAIGVEPAALLSSRGIWIGFGLAVGPQILGHGSMNYAVKYISPTLLGTLILAEPLFASSMAYLLFDEIPPLPSVVAMVVILSGILLTWRKK